MWVAATSWGPETLSASQSQGAILGAETNPHTIHRGGPNLLSQPLLPLAESLFLPSSHKAYKMGERSRVWGPGGPLTLLVNKYLLITHVRDTVEHACVCVCVRVC